MKSFLRLIFTGFLFVSTQISELRADHFIGGQLSYETVDLDSLRGVFQVTLRVERLCNSSSTFFPEYLIKVLEYNTKPSPNYSLSVYNAKLFDSSYIYYPCTPTNSACTGSSGQIIEVRYYRVQIVVQNTNKECVVFFDENSRSFGDNIDQIISEPLVLYTSFVPRYQNSLFKFNEAKRHFPLKNKLSEIEYTLSDTEGDSISYSTSLPFKALNYTISGPTMNYSLLKSQAKAGLNDKRPFYMQETTLINTPNTIQFTPTVEQSSWLTIVKSEFRKINLGIKDTWICISKSNMDRLFTMFDINTQFHLKEINSLSSAVKITNQDITICNDGKQHPINFSFPIESGIQTNKFKVFQGLTDISTQVSVVRKTGTGGVDTLILTYSSLFTGTNDLITNLRFDFDLCHTSSGIGFDRSFRVGLHVFNYKIFEKDTILSCASILSVPTLHHKPLLINWGTYSSSAKTITINNPKDTWLVAQLQTPHSLCPAKDSIYINQGSIFTLTTIGYSPSCKGYADAAAKVSVTGTNGPFTFRWSNSSTFDSITSIPAGKHSVEVRDKDNCKQTDTINIAEPAGITAHWVVDSPITCYKGSNGRGHIQVTSNIKPSQYLWTTVISADSFLMNLSAGAYEGQYKYTNLSNIICDQAYSFVIDEPDSIYLHIVTTDNTCFGEAKGKIAVLPVGGHGDFLFYFDNVETSVGYKDRLANGTVNVYAKDVKNCMSSIHPVTIKSPDRLKYNIIANNPSCAGVSNGSIAIHHPEGGLSPYVFSLNLGDFSSNTNFTDLGAGPYTLKMRDANNCTFVQSFPLSNSYTLNAKPDLIEDSRCPRSNTGKIHLDISNGFSPFKVYYKSDSSITTSTVLHLDNLSKGNYPIRIVDKNGCNWLSQYQINEPDTIKLHSILNHESCYGFKNGSIVANIVSGGNLPYGVMKWYDENNALLPFSQSLKPGIYYLRFNDQKNCSYEYTFQIKGKPQLKANLEVSQTINCHGYANGKIKSNTIGGSPPYSYQWRNYNQSLNSDLNNLPAGKYFISITDADNCSISDSIEISQPNPITLESLKIKNTDCPNSANGGITVLSLGSNGSNANLTYALKNKTDFSLSKTFTNLAKDNYTIIVKDSAGCQKEFEGEVKVDKSLEVQLAPSQSMEIGHEYQINPKIVLGENTLSEDITGYDWNPKYGLSCTDCLSPKFIATKTETFTIEVQYGKACKSSASTLIEVSKPEDVFIPNSFSPNGDNKNDIWYIHGKNVIGFEVHVYNRVGELVYSSSDINKGWDGTYRGTKENTNTYKYIVKVNYTDKSQRLYEGSLNLFR